MLPRDEIENLIRDHEPLVYRQEFLAEFVDWRGVQFFDRSKFLDANGQAYAVPIVCDWVFAVIDTASKDGKEHDGTAVTYYAQNAVYQPEGRGQRGDIIPLLVLDWEIVQIQGGLLDEWLPGVFVRLEELSRTCRARMGVRNTWMEDTGVGTVLIQQAPRRGWVLEGIPSDLTAMGKDARAINASSYVYKGQVKLCHTAHDKIETYKGSALNHWENQVFGFRIGDKDAAKRADDLLDTFTSGVGIALGNAAGF